MRILVLGYAFVCYLVGIAAVVYGIPWLAGIDCPQSVDTVRSASLGQAFIINTLLIFVFSLQHTIQARLSFKKVFNNLAHPSIERSTYVLMSGLAFGLMFWQWRGVEGVWIWRVEHPVGEGLLWALCAIGWLVAIMAIFMKNHFHFLGLRQGYLYFRGRKITSEPLKTSVLYSLVRHPMYFGFLLAYWATPTMSAGHFFFALLMTVYTLVGIQFEEKMLIGFLGEKYLAYRKKIPMLVPFTRWTRGDVPGQDGR